MAKLPDATSFGGRPQAGGQVSVPPGPQGSAGQVRSAIGRVPSPSFEIAGDLLNKVAAAQQRIHDRDSAVDRAKKITTFKQTATDELRRIQTEADISDDEVLRQYRDTIEANKTELLDSHGYSPDSQAQLQIQLEGLSGAAMGEATSLALTAKRAAVDDHLGATANGLYEQVYSNPSPENILTQFEEANRAIDNMAGALTPQEERAWRRTIESNLVKGGITSFIDRGNISGAEQMLRQIGVSEVLSADDRQQIFSRIGTAKAALASRSNAQKGPFVVGGALVTADGRELYRAPKEGEEDRPFGTGVTAGTLDVFNALAPKLDNGTATQEELNLLDTAITNYTQPGIDPETGLERRNELPAFLTRALEKSGRGDMAKPQETQDITGTARKAVQGKTVWDMASEGNLTGPVPAIGELLGKVPGLGGGAPEMTTARSYVGVIKRDLIRTLQNNPRFSEGERKAIEKDTDIDPVLFDNPDSYKQRLMGIADALDKRIADKTTVATSKTASREERRAAHNTILALENFMEALIPPRVATMEEAIQFMSNHKPGTVVLVKDGAEWLEMEVPPMEDQQ